MTEAARGPVHVTGEVLGSKKAGAYRLLTLAAPGVPERFRPGTFVAVSTGEGRLARRALWIHRIKPTGGYGATLEVLVDPVGPGTRWLAGLPTGSKLEITGPLGRAFSLPREPVSCVLVGDGYAAAPMFPLAERLRERDCGVTLVVAAADESRLVSALEARRSARSVTVVTLDGSVGRKGSAADVLPEVVAQAGAQVVYAAGPVATLHAAAEAAEAAGAWSQTALETSMTCGTGLCQGCAVPVVGEDGVGRMVRACIDGPVFRGDRVRWTDLDAATGEAQP